MKPATLLASLATAAFVSALAACGADDRPASWAYLHEAIIAPSCATASCHSEQAAVAGLRLHTAEAAYAVLVGRACGGDDPDGQAPRNYVDPGSPERSRLLYLLRGAEVSRPMPPDRLLPYRDVELISRWIEEGAPCD